MNKFTASHTSNTLEQNKQMLNELGFSSMDEFLGSVVPSSVRLRYNIELPKHRVSQHELETHIKQLADKNQTLRSFIGLGYYQNEGSPLLNNLLLNNPNWNIIGTNIGDEHKQGYLEGLFNFQTMVCSLTGMDTAACLGTDDATAAVQAMFMMHKLRSYNSVYNNHNILFVDQNISAQTMDLLLTYSEPAGIEIVCDNFDEFEFSGHEFGAILQYPSANGRVCDYDDFCATAHSNSTLVTAIVDLLALTMLKSPKSWGADIVVGGTQRLGSELNFADNNSGFISTRSELEASIPSTIVYNKDDKFLTTNNGDNCVASNPLSAIFAGLYAMLHGASGLLGKAMHSHSYAKALGDYIKDLGYTLTASEYFDTIEIDDVDSERISLEAQKSGINIYCPNPETVHISLDELTTLNEINTLAEILARLIGAKYRAIKSVDTKVSLLHDLQRKTPLLSERIFSDYNSNRGIESHIKGLERLQTTNILGARDIASSANTVNCFPNPALMPEFKNIHPFAPAEQTKGYSEIIDYLSQVVSSLTGLDACSFQPSSEVSAIYSGFMIIRGYYQGRGQGHRNIALIPASTPQHYLKAATMAGMKVVTINITETSSIDLKDLKDKVNEHSGELGCLFVTNPTPADIREAIDIIHDNRAQVFIDGSCMSELIGLCSAGYIGADLSYINLNSIFKTPSMGGSSALVALSVARHLEALLPTHPIVATGGKQGITAIASAAYSCALSLPLIYAGFKTCSEQQLLEDSQQALLNKAYLKFKLGKNLEANQQTLNKLLEQGFYSSAKGTSLEINTLSRKHELDELINTLKEI